MSMFDDCPGKPRVEELERWEARQNGSLQRIESKVDRLLFWILGGMSGIILSLLGTVLALKY